MKAKTKLIIPQIKESLIQASPVIIPVGFVLVLLLILLLLFAPAYVTLRTVKVTVFFMLIFFVVTTLYLLFYLRNLKHVNQNQN